MYLKSTPFIAEPPIFSGISTSYSTASSNWKVKSASIQPSRAVLLSLYVDELAEILA